MPGWVWLVAATLPRTGLPDNTLIWVGAGLVAVSLVLAVTLWFRRG
jgi:LPXTG-motif cell wall-anchored protein